MFDIFKTIVKRLPLQLGFDLREVSEEAGSSCNSREQCLEAL